MSGENVGTVQSGDLGAYLRSLAADAFSPDPHVKYSAQRLLDGYVTSHGQYIRGVATAARNEIGRDGSVAVELSEGEGRTSVFTFDGDPTRTIDPVDFGLPSLADAAVLGVLLYSGDKGQETIEAIVAEKRTAAFDGSPLPPNRFHLLRLENSAAAVEGPNAVHGVEKAHWVQPGSSKITADSSLRLAVLSGQEGQTELRVAANENSGRLTLLRAQPATEERKKSLALSPADQISRLRKKERRQRASAASLLAAVVLQGMALVGRPSQNPTALEVTTATELVTEGDQPAIDDVPQAESSFDTDTLRRSREAVDAYMKGNVAALHNQQQRYGYNTNWIKADTFEKIQAASDYAELEAVFNGAFSRLHVSLSVFGPHEAYQSNDRNDARDLGEMDRSIIRTKLGSADLENAKRMTVGIAQTLESFDEKMFTDGEMKLVFQLTKNLNTIEPPKDNDAEKVTRKVDGLARHTASHEAAVIDLDVDSTFSPPELVGHEFAHVRDSAERGKPSGTISSLNPRSGGQIYVGASYPAFSTKIDGGSVFSSQYSRYNPQEDYAEGAAAWQGPSGSVELDRSPRGEKLMYVLFDLESQYPGATAAFLQKQQPHVYRADTKDKLWYALNATGSRAQGHQNTLNGALGTSLALLFGTSFAARRQRRTGTRKY
ncbi:MAG: hypothetical protein WBP03_02865 [Candidatus Saccharimonadales bacterium]|jgi:hypothetical protein